MEKRGGEWEREGRRRRGWGLYNHAKIVIERVKMARATTKKADCGDGWGRDRRKDRETKSETGEKGEKERKEMKRGNGCISNAITLKHQGPVYKHTSINWGSNQSVIICQTWTRLYDLLLLLLLKQNRKSMAASLLDLCLCCFINRAFTGCIITREREREKKHPASIQRLFPATVNINNWGIVMIVPLRHVPILPFSYRRNVTAVYDIITFDSTYLHVLFFPEFSSLLLFVFGLLIASGVLCRWRFVYSRSLAGSVAWIIACRSQRANNYDAHFLRLVNQAKPTS